jgi:aminopeptidase N
MIKKIIFPIVAALFIFSCKTTETVTLPEQTIEIENPFKAPTERPTYQGSNTKEFDLIHTKLAVSFNWEKSQMYGKAELTLKPHFYKQKELVLDARGMDINKVQLLTDDTNQYQGSWSVQPLEYDYDSFLITITLPKEYTKNDTLRLFVDYTSNPNDLKEGGSSAISSDKGLYFINPKGEDKDKMPQIWTQGETQSNSAWFPTIDSPNQKSTEEIAITIAEKYTTLSNGILTHSEENGDGTRTDFWEMNQPHAPYLFMMAIGEFKIVKDTWKEMEVNYYVEEEFEPYAKDIFGLTPEMLEFYSNVLGVKYPWQKYSQVVVRDYVSGAMENTSAVIHGDFVYQTKREMIDGSSGEGVIAHELFHHWFGDLVTCESWSNLPLNESFATYGEFLWNEHKHGDDKAAQGLQTDLSNYLQQAKQGHKNMIRFDFEAREEMFDGHSYQKGGRILHMLRKYIGDEAFFASLKLYLETNKYTDVEMHQLRLACEKITGEDLNWFFNQWFYASGHPILDINYEYNDSLKTQTITVEQMQDLEKTPLYKIPVKIDLYVNGKTETKEVVVDKTMNTFVFEVSTQPDLVNFDADKMLLCEKVDNHKSIKEWAFMYHNAPNYLDRYEAIKKLQKSSDEVATNTIIDALSDKYQNIRRNAMRGLKKAVKANPDKVKSRLLDLAKNDENSRVRGSAIASLSKYFNDAPEVKAVFVNGVTEQSYHVIGRSLNAISKNDSEEAMKFAKTLEVDKNGSIINSVSGIYAEHGEAEQLDYFIKTSEKLSGFSKYGFVMSYSKYLKKQSNETVEKGMPVLKDIAMNENAWWMRMIGIRAITDIETMYGNRIHVAETELKELDAGSDKELDLRNSIDADKTLQGKIKTMVEEIKEKEKHPRLRKMLGLKD